MDNDSSAPIRRPVATRSFRHATAPIGSSIRASSVRVLGPDRERTPASGLYHAHIGIHQSTRKPLSVWLLRPSLTATPADANQLVDDVLRAGAFRHANVERAVDVGEHDAGMYVAWLRSASVLSDVSYYHSGLKRMGIPQILSGAAAGLDAAHRALLVHGCLSATDICVHNGAATIVGVGVWRLRRDVLRPLFVADPTSSIAPEVQAGGAISPAADVYSLAVIAARLALRLAASLPVDSLRGCLATQHPSLRAVFAALAAEPKKRPTSPLEVAEELATFWPRWP